MNHLAHLRTAWPDAELMAGCFLGDFVKGRLRGHYPPGIERGIALHRAVDAFSDQHPITRQSVRRFEPRFRRVGPIMVDIIYDHCLARDWQAWHEMTLTQFADTAFDALFKHADSMPNAARETATRMAHHRSLEGYANPAFVDRSFQFLASRLRGNHPLDEAYDEFLAHGQELNHDFELFFPLLCEFVTLWRQQHGEPG